MQFNGTGKWAMMAAMAAIGFACVGQVVPPPAPATRPSPNGVSYAAVEEGKGVVIYYSRPNVTLNGTKRVIWGTLVPWGQVWRLGANEATLMVTPVALDIGGTAVPAGTYTLFMLPVENGDSKLIISKMVGQQGGVYDEKQDLARVTLKRDALTTPVDQLIIALVPTEPVGGATLKVAWEGVQYSVAMKKK